MQSSKFGHQRIDQLIAEGKKGAIAAKKVITHLDEYLSACQLGITVTALGLGSLGEPTFRKILLPIFDYFPLTESMISILSFVIAFAFVTFIHVVVGELLLKPLLYRKQKPLHSILLNRLFGFTALCTQSFGL